MVDFSKLTVSDDDGSVFARSSSRTPSQLAGYVKAAYGKPARIKLPNEGDAKTVVAELRKDAAQSGLGLRVRVVPDGKGVAVVYEGRDKRQRQYTADDMRAYLCLASGEHITRAQRYEFRVAHDCVTNDDIRLWAQIPDGERMPKGTVAEFRETHADELGSALHDVD